MMRIHSLLVSTLLTVSAAAQGLGTVFTLGNEPTGNTVRVQLRLPNGALLPFGAYPTGGEGTGEGLGSQAALATSRGGNLLFAVDAGSDELTMFRVLGGVFLWRLDTVDSGGDRPTSVAEHRGLVYVLNAGSDSVRGFRRQGGQLQPIANATYSLSQAGAAAAQVGFSPDGDHLVVTERATDRIAVFPVLGDGRLEQPTFTASAGQTPFGFEFRGDGVLVVSEAAGGAPGASTVSTYRITQNHDLQVVAAAVPTQQAAACWVALSPGGFAYTTNTASGTISGLSIDANAQATLLDPDGVTADLGAAGRPIDAAFSRRGRFLYVLDAGHDEIRGFRRMPDGSLHALNVAVPQPDGAAGMIVR